MLGLVAAAGALGLARSGAPLLGVPDAAPLAWAGALVLLLAWLWAPAPLGGGARLLALLSPDPRQPWSAALPLIAAWALGTALLATAAGDIASQLDPVGTIRRPAEVGEVLRQGVLSLLVAAFHGALCLGWPLGGGLGARGGIALAGALGMGAAVMAAAGEAGPGELVLAAAAGGVGTVVMAMVVRVGGRVWPVVLANGFAGLVPLLAHGPVAVPT
jgi:hypothetical protein